MEVIVVVLFLVNCKIICLKCVKVTVSTSGSD